MKKIALVIGHRYGSQGAYGAAGYSEYRYYDALFLPALVGILGAPSWLKVFHRQNRQGYTANMKQLHQEIDDWGAAVAVSFHFDAADSRQANGHTVLYNERDVRSKAVAKIFDRHFDAALQSHDRNLLGRYRGRGGGFLRRGESVNVLLEPFFASHQKQFVPGTEGFEALLHAVASSILEMQGEQTHKAAVTTVAPTYHLGSRSLAALHSVKSRTFVRIVEEAITITQQDFSVLEGGRIFPYPRSGNTQQVLDAFAAAAKVIG